MGSLPEYAPGGKLESAGEMREHFDMRRPQKLIHGDDSFQTITAVDENPRISRKTRRIARNIENGWNSRTRQVSRLRHRPDAWRIQHNGIEIIELGGR